MTCYTPLSAWQSIARNSEGKSELVFKEPKGWDYKPIKIPCSRCIGCRLERSRQWAVRCMHEASLYSSNCFITLTFDAQHLPDDMSLDVDVFQRFMKRLRKRFSGIDEVVGDDGLVSKPIRFYHCGEYGEQFGRPHYHACIFNFDFDDKYVWKVSNGYPLYRSPALEELWPYGYSSVGAVTYESAGYVARYILKKVLGKGADDHYFDPSTGVYKRPEYTTMSRRPGIAAGWFKKYGSDVFPRDSVLVNGSMQRVPRYYDTLCERFNPELWFDVKCEREAKNVFDNTERPSLDSQRRVREAQIKRLVRSVE